MDKSSSSISKTTSQELKSFGYTIPFSERKSLFLEKRELFDKVGQHCEVKLQIVKILGKRVEKGFAVLGVKHALGILMNVLVSGFDVLRERGYSFEQNDGVILKGESNSYRKSRIIN